MRELINIGVQPFLLGTALLSDYVEALPDGALIVDASGNIVAANDFTRDALQLEPKGLLVHSVLRNSTITSAIAEVWAAKAPVTVDVEIYGKLPRQFGVYIAPIGGSGNLLITLRDLTREQRLEKMRSDFVANASHEMRTPLATIMGTIETLQGAARNDPKARDMFLDTMLVQARRMKRLIDDLLTLSRIELNEHVRPNAKVDLLDVAKQARGNLNELAKAHKVEVEVMGGTQALVRGDSEELLQVAQNLLENAVKYGSNGGHVEIEVQSSGETGRAVLSVRDFGKGIAKVHLPRLTERFYRVNAQESRAQGGTGLGLAIVKHIVSRHRGQLEIQSELGQGSTFSVTIPLFQSVA
jgi:two-component system, OmpR family, phosphate regulon sensor histidine kinase PhoR